MDLAHLSDEDLLKLHQQSTSLKDLSDQDLKDLYQSHQTNADLDHSIGKGESLLRGASQGATLGFQDELSPYIEKLLANTVGDQATQDLYANKSVDSLRDTYRQQNSAAEQANPLSFLGGQVLGSAPMNIALGGQGLAGNVASNAALGGVQAIGSSDASNLGDLAKEGLKGSALGGGIALGGAGLGKAAQMLAPKASDLAERFAVKALGRTPRVIDNLAEKGQLNQFGREVLDKDLLGWLQSPEQTANKVGAGFKEAGKNIGSFDQSTDQLIQDLQSMGVKGSDDLLPTGKSLGKELRQNVIEPMSTERGMVAPSQTLDRYVANEVEGIRPRDQMDLSELRGLKGKIREKVNYYGNPINQDTSSQSAFNSLSGGVEEKMDSIIGKLKDFTPEDLQGQYKDLNKEYGFFKKANELTQDTMERLQRNNILGLPDLAVGGALGLGSSAHGQDSKSSVLTGLGGALAYKYGRQRFPAFAANALDSVSKALSLDPSAMGKYGQTLVQAAQRGGTELAVTHYVLSQSDPDYRDQLNKINGEQNQ